MTLKSQIKLSANNKERGGKKDGHGVIEEKGHYLKVLGFLFHIP